ncbi:MAG: DoxX family protein [Nocardioidaceae bacterium]
MALVRLLARPMLSTMFIAGGINSLKNSDYLAERAKPVTDRLMPAVERATASLPITVDHKTIVKLNGVVHVVGGAMLATGRWPRLSSLVLAATLVPTTLGGHRFWEESDPQQRVNQRVHLLKNISMGGGLLLASVDTQGKPSLAWRAKHGADKAKQKADKAKQRAGKLTNS